MPIKRIPTRAGVLATVATMVALFCVASLASAGSGAPGPRSAAAVAGTETTERTFEAECEADPGGSLQQGPAPMTFAFHAVVPSVVREGERISFSGASAEIALPRVWTDELYALGVRSVIGKETHMEVDVSGATPTEIDGFRSSEYTEGLPIEKRSVGYETERITFRAPTVGGAQKAYALGPVVAGKAGEMLTLTVGTKAGYEPGVRAIENQGLQSWITGYWGPNFTLGVVEAGPRGRVEHLQTGCTAPAGVVLVETEIQPSATTTATTTTGPPSTTTASTTTASTAPTSTTTSTTTTSTTTTTTSTTTTSTTTTTAATTTTSAAPTTTTDSPTTTTATTDSPTTTTTATGSPSTTTTTTDAPATTTTTTGPPSTSVTTITTGSPTTTTTESPSTTTTTSLTTTTTTNTTTTTTTTAGTTTSAATTATTTTTEVPPTVLGTPPPGPEFGGPALSPVIGRTAVVAPTAGTVLVEQPHSHRFLPLAADASVPVGSVVDAAHGVLNLTTALGPRGATQTVTVWDGTFTVAQGPRGSGITVLTLRGLRLDCQRHGLARVSAVKPRILWARDHHGRYTTHGANSAATVLGTEWETVETCAGTITRVRRGRVRVRDLHTNRTTVVTAGHSFLARP